MRVWRDELKTGVPPGPTLHAKAPEKWDDLVAAYEKANSEYRAVIAGATENDLAANVHFFTGPKTMGAYRRIDWVWFLLSDEIHHRGQFSIYVRAAGGKLPSIYGPTADEPWN